MALKDSEEQRAGMNKVVAPLMETFGLNRALTLLMVFSSVLVVGFALFWFFHSAPPRVLIMTSGPPGSTFETNALQYQKILGSNHVTLKIIPSQGSLENLQRLNDPKFRVDVGFVQGGVTNGLDHSDLVSLGSISYEPLMIFYRGGTTLGMLSELAGKRLAIGPVGSGTHSVAVTLLQLNGLDATNTTLLELDPLEASKALVAGKLDAVFLMGDSASPKMMRELLLRPGIQIFNFAQADGYARRITYLTKLEIPMGTIDFGRNIPAHDLYLVSPTVEILARPNLHPALSDLLLEAVREVNGGPSILKRKGEFPAGLEHDFPLSADAARFYKSGKSFLYRYLPFWLASLVNRILVAFVPLVIVIIPGLRAIPALYKWRIRLLLLRRYRALLVLERDLLDAKISARHRKELLTRLDQIEINVNKMKVPASFAGQFYELRGHIGFVRARLLEPAPVN